MNLLVVTTVPVTLEAFLLPYGDHFRRRGWTVHALANGASDSMAVRDSFDHAFDIGWSRSPIDTLRNLQALASRVQEVVADGAYDIVHVHTPIAAFVTRYALRDVRSRMGTRVLYTAHGFHFHSGGHPLKNVAFLGLEKLAGRWTDDLVLINQEDMEQARRYGIVPPSRTHFVPGIGMDIEGYVARAGGSNNQAAIRDQIGLRPDDRLALMIAEFTRGKRHVDAIDALAACEVEGLHLALAGTGPLVEDIKRHAEQVGVRDRVHFLGFRKDIPALLSASDACLLPSEREGLPRSVMEAMAVGVPVVGTDIRGMQDLLRDGAGILVPVGAPDEIARAFERLVTNPQLHAQIAETAKARVKEYDLKRVIAHHEQLYELGARDVGKRRTPSVGRPRQNARSVPAL